MWSSTRANTNIKYHKLFYFISIDSRTNFMKALYMQQQSAAEGNWDPTQLLKPHFRFPEQSLSLSQSPSPAPQGFELEQHPHVSASDVPLQVHLGVGLSEIIHFIIIPINFVVQNDHEKSLFKLLFYAIMYQHTILNKVLFQL